MLKWLLILLFSGTCLYGQQISVDATSYPTKGGHLHVQDAATTSVDKKPLVNSKASIDLKDKNSKRLILVTLIYPGRQIRFAQGISLNPNVTTVHIKFSSYNGNPEIGLMTITIIGSDPYTQYTKTTIVNSTLSTEPCARITTID